MAHLQFVETMPPMVAVGEGSSGKKKAIIFDLGIQIHPVNTGLDDYIHTGHL